MVSDRFERVFANTLIRRDREDALRRLQRNLMAVQVSNSNTTELRDYFNKRRRETLALTRTLVEAESPSGNQSGSKAVVSLLAAAARNISAVTTIERVPAESYGEHLRVHAFGSNRSRGKTILLLGHTDTVHPFGSLERRPWRVE